MMRFFFKKKLQYPLFDFNNLLVSEYQDYYFTKYVPQFSNYEIGEWTYGNPQVLSWGEKSTLKIGKFCSIASDVTIFLGGNHRADWVTTYPFNIFFSKANHLNGHPTTNGDVIIGNDVWIGRSATILSGIEIGNGAIVGANSLVTKSVDPYTIVGGNPAKVIRKRFSDENIESLLNISWWNWDINKILENIDYFLQDDIEKFIEAFRKPD